MPERATEDRFQVKPRNTQSYVCPKCGENGEAPKMWVPVDVFCDGCGTQMTPATNS